MVPKSSATATARVRLMTFFDRAGHFANGLTATFRLLIPQNHVTIHILIIDAVAIEVGITHTLVMLQQPVEKTGGRRGTGASLVR
jgi:hypothetical protein